MDIAARLLSWKTEGVDEAFNLIVSDPILIVSDPILICIAGQLEAVREWSRESALMHNIVAQYSKAQVRTLAEWRSICSRFETACRSIRELLQGFMPQEVHGYCGEAVGLED